MQRQAMKFLSHLISLWISRVVCSLYYEFGLDICCILPLTEKQQRVIYVVKRKSDNSKVLLTLQLKKQMHLLRTPPKAQGIRTSHSCTSNSLGSIASAPAKFFKLPVLSLCWSNSAILMPSKFLTAPVMSLTAMTLPPLS